MDTLSDKSGEVELTSLKQRSNNTSTDDVEVALKAGPTRDRNSFYGDKHPDNTNNSGTSQNQDESLGSKEGDQEQSDPPGKCSLWCLSCQHCCYRQCKPYMTKYNSVPQDASRITKCHHAFLCPPHGKLAKWFTLLFVAMVMFGVFWGITGANALPGGNLFALYILMVFAWLLGVLAGKIKLPPLFGMLIAGAILKNVPHINFAADINRTWSSTIRNMAFDVILIRAVLGLDPASLTKAPGAIVRLAAIPCLIEAATVGVVSHFLLNFPWVWAFLLGFVIAPISPAVVISSMIVLQDQGYGVEQGIPQILIPAAILDNVITISGFGILLTVAFSTGAFNVYTVFKGPIEALMGILCGALVGLLMWYLPHKKHKHLVLFRFLILFMAALFSTFGSKAAGASGAGALGVLSMTFVASYRWRQEGWIGKENPLGRIMVMLWRLFEPLLFGLIGAEIDIAKLDGATVGFAIATLFIGFLIRMVAAFVAVTCAPFSWKEKFFLPFAWFPKATVQAAIGSIALDMAQELPDSNPDKATKVTLGLQILSMAVLAILFTAPPGATAIKLAGTRLLKLPHDTDSAKNVPDCDNVKTDKEKISLSENELEENV
ncbi:unnamed protein product [Owenia fusiformis]|uniref:Cation/H+ exchanger transmembrane domain-containing protein n=1 Tax=Owenia fusiformis TaxID=6347 RepID=A0A8S4PQN5_OWEFU|nr:unnamed protein product [Owenia fusiformis]